MGFISTFTWKKGIVKFGDDFRRAASYPWFQGVLLMGCVVAAMLLANLPFTKELYHNLLEAKVQIRFLTGNGTDIHFPKDMTVEKLINDILMVVFFFTVGLEIRREIAHGELSSPKKAMLPVIAAFGGVMAPACIYALINSGTAAASGWGIPTATDIAFVVCILTMLGDKVPVSIKVFLTALAIADDLIAILVVAIFYGGSINLGLLGISLLVILAAMMLKKVGEKRILPYMICAVLVWILFYYSGVHATMSGVVMAFLIPAEPRYSKYQYIRKRDRLLVKLAKYDNPDPEDFPNAMQKDCLRRLEAVANGSMDMSYRVERFLSPWVNYLIMPIFALANAGVVISDASYFNIFKFDPALGSVSMGIFLGLLIGKPVGITLFSWIATKLKLGEMPTGANWSKLFAAACLGGIGFTMSIFVDTLSFGGNSPEVMMQLRNAGKIAILLASVSAGVFGSIMVNIADAAGKRHIKK